MQRLFPAITTIFLVLLLHGLCAAKEGDVSGASDHPLIGRYADSVIVSHYASGFDDYTLITGPVVTQNNITSSQKLEGKVTRIVYKAPLEYTDLEIYRNFEIKMKDAGFQPLYACSVNECGKLAFLRTIEKDNKMQASMGDFRYLAAKLARPEGDIYVSLLVSPVRNTGPQNNGIYTQLVVTEVAGMAYKMIDAAKMAKEIAEKGSVSLYGIYFDTDKTDIKPESKPILDEVAKLLKANASLRLIVVGHTDNVGTLEYNMDLSQRRVRSVVKVLASQYGINGARLSSHGVGFLAPVASNKTEAGRSKNRRVELVER